MFFAVPIAVLYDTAREETINVGQKRIVSGVAEKREKRITCFRSTFRLN
jgi:hypothetical protein